MRIEHLTTRHIMDYLKVVCIAGLGVFLGSCSAQPFQFDFTSPGQIQNLEKQLNEISGLHWVDSKTVACVQDEKARIYFLNVETGEVESRMDFGKKGDFEGVTQWGDAYYVLRSDGAIFEVDEAGKSKKYKFLDSEGFDFEGICADGQNQRLLVACKEHGKKSQRNSIFIYSFSLTSHTYAEKPFLQLSKEGIHSNFKSSGIALHPNGDLYLLSSASRTLLVLNPDGTKKFQTQLSKSIFQQPEGITFSPSGTLFISNEKNKTTPTLLRFDPQTPSQ